MGTALPAPALPSAFPSGARSTRVGIGLCVAMLVLSLFVSVGLWSGADARHHIAVETRAELAQLGLRLAGSLELGLAERLRDIEDLAELQVTFGRPMMPEQWRALAERLQRVRPDYAWVGVTDADGVVIAGTDGVLEGRDLSQQPWFVHGTQRGHVGEVQEAILLASLRPPSPGAVPQRVIDLAAPMHDDGGRLAGVVAAQLDWGWAEARRQRVLRSIDPARNIELVLLDHNGDALLGGPVEADAPGERARYLAANSADQAQAPLRSRGWSVVARAPRDRAMLPAQVLQLRIAALGFAAAMLSGIAGWWLAGRLTEPLRGLALQAQRYAAPPAGLPRGDEIAELSACVDALVDELQARDGELRNVSDSFEARVRERTALLHQANADLQSFSRSVSHDLKGPIATIGRVLADVLETDEGRLCPQSRHALRLLSAECVRLGRLVDELMALAMVEQQSLEPRRVSMRALVQAVAEGLASPAAEPTLRDAMARTTLVVGPLPDALGDEVLLRQVWQNLIGNAVKFSSRVESPRIDVHAEHIGGEWVYSVTDNGAGFDPARTELLFTVFRRLHSPTDFPGTGIGLSIVKRVVHRHGGRVWANSAPGGGAQFYFALPAQAVCTPLPRPAEERAFTAAPAAKPPAAETEDSPVIA